MNSIEWLHRPVWRFVLPAILAISAIYSVVGVFTFTTSQLPHLAVEPFIFSMCVLVPYAIFAALDMSARDSFSGIAVLVAAVAAAALGGSIYSLSFSPNDREYAVVYFIVPALQLVPAAVALGIVVWRKRRGKSAA
jgi:hypothetical protein